MATARTSAVLGRRTCALAAACSAVLHAAMVGDSGNPARAVLVVAMAAACLYCAYELWTHGALRVWCTVAVMNLAMIGAHLSAPSHHHGAASGQAVAAPSTLMTAATLVAIGEVVIATAVLCVRTRGRSGYGSSSKFTGGPDGDGADPACVHLETSIQPPPFFSRASCSASHNDGPVPPFPRPLSRLA